MTVRKIVQDISGIKGATSTFGGAYSSHAALRARNIKFKPGLSVHSPGYQKLEAVRGPDNGIPGAYGGQLSFEIMMRGVAASTSEWSFCVKDSGTLHERAGASAKVTNATSTTLVALTADIGTYVVGDGIMVTGTGTDTQIRFITRVQDDVPGAGSTTLTISPSWADTPANGDSVVALDTWTPMVGEAGAYHEWLVYTGAGSTDRHLYTVTDCALSNWKLNSTGADALPVLEMLYECDSWASSEASTTVTADSLNPASPVLGDCFYVDGTSVLIESIAFDAGLKMTPITATAGNNGRGGWLYVGCEPKLEVKPYHDTDWISKLENATTFEGMFESIKDADEGWAIWCPKLQVVSIEPGAMGNEIQGDNPELMLVDPGANADSTNYPLFAVACVGDGP